MQSARITDNHGNLLTNENGGIVKIPASRLGTKEKARAYLDNLKERHGNTDLNFCCAYGACRASVHFRKASEMVAGTRSRSRNAAWISDDVNAHVANCPGPHEVDINHLPHNELTVEQAARKHGEAIVVHLNIQLGETPLKAKYNKAGGLQPADVKFRKENPTSHSYFPVSSLQELTDILSKVLITSNIDGLNRVHIAHEGSLTALSQFIVRNDAKDRMQILYGRGEDRGLYNAASVKKQYYIKEGGDCVFGSPRLVMFEAPEHQKLIIRRDGNLKRANGWRHDVGDGRRVVYDQLNLAKTNLTYHDLFPNGAVVLARPFIHKDQNHNYPAVHWSIESEENICLNSPKEIIKLLCWNGQHTTSNEQRLPKQLKLAL